MNVANDLDILIVDDDAFNREGMHLYLQQDFSILEAGDEATAYETALRRQPDADIIDIVIPPAPEANISMSQSVGIRLTRRLKR